MRRLDIVLIGQSQALTDLALELEQHGHSLVRTAAFGERTLGNVDLLIDDDSLVFSDLGDVPRLTLQLGLGLPESTGLPTLDLLCSYDSALFTRVPIAEEPSGNGQALRLRAVAELVDHVALLVSRFSRDTEYFRCTEPTAPARSEEHTSELQSLRHLV